MQCIDAVEINGEILLAAASSISIETVCDHVCLGRPPVEVSGEMLLSNTLQNLNGDNNVVRFRRNGQCAIDLEADHDPVRESSLDEFWDDLVFRLCDNGVVTKGCPCGHLVQVYAER